MFANYLKIAIRNILKTKWQSAIKITGMSLGIACSILIFAFVYSELNHDVFHQNADDIYRVVLKGEIKDHGAYHSPRLKYEMVSILEKEYPSIAHVSSFRNSSAEIVRGNEKFDETIALVDSAFLSIFSFPLLAGDPHTALAHPDQIVITEELAQKCFGSLEHDYADVLGQELSLPQVNGLYRISGVLKSIPKTSSLQFDCLVRGSAAESFSMNMNMFGFTTIFIQLKPHTDRFYAEKSLEPIRETLYGEVLQNMVSGGYIKDKSAFQFYLQPLQSIYLDKNCTLGYNDSGDIVASYILSGIGALIILLACINFITLSLGHTVRRAAEIGVRKTLGALKRQIVSQYLIEVLVLLLAAVWLGYTLATLFAPTFSQYTQYEADISLLNNLQMPLFILALLFLTLLFSGGLPALALAKMDPSRIFRSSANRGGKNAISSVLVVVQFFLTIGLLSCLLVMTRQTHFLLHKDLGFQKENVLVVPTYRNQADILKNKLLQHAEITAVSTVDRVFTDGYSDRPLVNAQGDKISVNFIKVDADYLNTLDLELVAGRNFSDSIASDFVNAAIVNEALVSKMAFEEALGQEINDTGLGTQPLVVIGVVKDFHIQDLHQEIKPLLLHTTPNLWGFPSLLIRFNAQDMGKTIADIERDFKEIFPDNPCNYSFLDENLGNQYQNEKRWQNIMAFSTLFAIVISALGLVGLAAILTARRTKEIGIRKAVGGSIKDMVVLLTKDFAKWVLVANIFAWPVAWYAMHKWLQNFAYHINLSWWLFALAGILALMIAMLTVSVQAMRAAAANPVEALRYE